MTIKTPGKFEGQEDYAPYFYDEMLEGNSERHEIDGDEIDVFDVTEDCVDRFPQLRSRLGEKIAFRETDQGFWEEVELPAEVEEAEAEEELEPDLSTEAVITDTGRSRNGISLSIEGKHIGSYKDVAEALGEYRRYTKRHGVYYNIFYVSDHGNSWQIDEHGNELKGLSGVGDGGERVGMYLRWFPVNNAFAFVFGDPRDVPSLQPIRLHHEEMFFQKRKEAVAAARRLELQVDKKTGRVTTLSGAVPPLQGINA